MTSYFNRRTVGASDMPPRHRNDRMASGHPNVGAPVQFPPATQKQGKNQQSQPQSCLPPQGLVEHRHRAPQAAAGHPYDNPAFRCHRCRHPFLSQAELDHHTFVCGAASLLTEMFTPYSAQQTAHERYYPPPQPRSQAAPSDGAGTFYKAQHHLS